MTDSFGTVTASLMVERGGEYVTATHAPNWMWFAHQLPTHSYETIRKAVTGERLPSEGLMLAVAAHFEVEPTIFREWNLLAAQKAFDPREVGEEAAYANLEAWLATAPQKKPARRRKAPASLRDAATG